MPRHYALPTLIIAIGSMLACGGSHNTSASQAPAPVPAPSTNAAGATASSRMASAPGTLPAGVTAAMVAEGDSIFNARRSCSRCHGDAGVDGRGGPDLTTGKYQHATGGTYAAILQVINDGVSADQIKDPAHRFPMRPRGGLDLTDAQAQAVAAYVWTLGHK